MKMDEETFAEYAKKLEFEDFEDEVKLCIGLAIGFKLIYQISILLSIF